MPLARRVCRFSARCEGALTAAITNATDSPLAREAVHLLPLATGPEKALALADTPLPIPADAPEWLSPILAVMPGQLLGLHLSLAKGLSPDSPRGLSKVTVTR